MRGRRLEGMAERMRRRRRWCLSFGYADHGDYIRVAFMLRHSRFEVFAPHPVLPMRVAAESHHAEMLTSVLGSLAASGHRRLRPMTIDLSAEGRTCTSDRHRSRRFLEHIASTLPCPDRALQDARSISVLSSPESRRKPQGLWPQSDHHSHLGAFNRSLDQSNHRW